MRIVLVLLVVLLSGAAMVSAQTATLTPTPIPEPTFTPYPTLDAFGTYTAIPALSLTPKPWDTPTPLASGIPYQIPQLILGTPSTSEPAVVHGFEAISESNSQRLGVYIAEVAVGFYGWARINFPAVLRALRVFSLIIFLMLSLYGIVLRVAPDLVSKANAWRNKP